MILKFTVYPLVIVIGENVGGETTASTRTESRPQKIKKPRGASPSSPFGTAPQQPAQPHESGDFGGVHVPVAFHRALDIGNDPVCIVFGAIVFRGVRHDALNSLVVTVFVQYPAHFSIQILGYAAEDEFTLPRRYLEIGLNGVSEHVGVKFVFGQ